MSSLTLRALRKLQLDTTRDREAAFAYYRREMKMGARRASYYAARRAYPSPLELAQRGYFACSL